MHYGGVVVYRHENKGIDPVKLKKAESIVAVYPVSDLNIGQEHAYKDNEKRTADRTQIIKGIFVKHKRSEINGTIQSIYIDIDRKQDRQAYKNEQLRPVCFFLYYFNALIQPVSGEDSRVNPDQSGHLGLSLFQRISIR